MMHNRHSGLTDRRPGAFWRRTLWVPRFGKSLLCLVSCLWGISPGHQVRAQSHLFTFAEGQPGQGAIVRIAGDVNKDGFDDVLLGFSSGPLMGPFVYVVQVQSGRDGRVLWTFKLSSGWAHDILGPGDLDRDGFADIVLAVENTAAKRRELWYYSGKTGKKFRTVHLKGYSWILSLARGGDVNADGYPDLLLGDPQQGSQPSPTGRVSVFSGKDGSRIHDIMPAVKTNYSFGSQIAEAGDTDEDGYADFLVASRGGGRNQLPVAYIYSGKTGKVLHTFASNLSRWTGLSVGSVGDLNKDGRRDYAIACLDRGPLPYHMPVLNYIEIRSGAKKDKHKVLLKIKELNPIQSMIGMTAILVGDINKDGIPDLAVGISQYGAGWIEYRSGKDGKFLSLVRSLDKRLIIGYQIGALGDVNGDGIPDLYTPSLTASWARATLPKDYIYSGTPMDLWSDTHRVSLSKQGKQVLQLDAGPKHAGSSYFVLGSLSGIKPGLKLGGLTLPLQPDLYFWLTASSPNSAMFQGSLGVLDSLGRATCTITALKGLPAAWVGARADHAYILFKNGRFTKTSHWTPLLFEK